MHVTDKTVKLCVGLGGLHQTTRSNCSSKSPEVFLNQRYRDTKRVRCSFWVNKTDVVFYRLKVKLSGLVKTDQNVDRVSKNDVSCHICIRRQKSIFSKIWKIWDSVYLCSNFSYWSPCDWFEEECSTSAVLQRVHQVSGQHDEILHPLLTPLTHLARLTSKWKKLSFNLIFERFSRKVFEVYRQVIRLAKVGRVIPIARAGFQFVGHFVFADLQDRKFWRHVDVRKDKISFCRLWRENLFFGDVTQHAVNAGLVEKNVIFK